MDLRVLVLIADRDLGGLVSTQVDNLGGSCSVAETYDEGSSSLGWADAAVVDLAGDGLNDLYRLRIEAPTVRVLAIAPDEELAERARAAGVDRVLVEPMSVADIGDAVRSMAHSSRGSVIDLRGTAPALAEAAASSDDDAPWWATRTR
ncbi:MAG: hypothetical protein ACT4OV_05035 [Microthrixaceae bacterium]